MVTGLAAVFFYLFSAVLLWSAVTVIVARNPVHAVLFLILAFFNGAGLFLLLGAEFLAFILIIVYVGAVAVLFLFVVMMLDVDYQLLKRSTMRSARIALLVALCLLFELLAVFFYKGKFSFINAVNQPIDGSEPVLSNTEAIGRVLYTDYVFSFELAGVVLLLAMVAAIILTLRKRRDVKRQNVAEQVARTQEKSIAIKKVAFREGIGG